MNPVIPRFFRRALLVCVALAALTYVSDYLYLEFRIWAKTDPDPLESLTVYNATNTKGGKLVIFYEKPEQEICVHSLFPHMGHRPCWYIEGSRINFIQLVTPKDGEDVLLQPPGRP